ncbi:hypothetical protein CgunFtcFv8_011133 [Champsocephalus gunnari]|uniref:Uncharacterized protein n=1 Tax=Champsocephalus gunnari TaxID=52237 RepID=A0AAN8DWL3_CHAGU|nr:hypothetical protein CgunFtcFv8_011133 [Champsocephalus gunnari]
MPFLTGFNKCDKSHKLLSANNHDAPGAVDLSSFRSNCPSVSLCLSVSLPRSDSGTLAACPLPAVTCSGFSPRVSVSLEICR